MPALESSIECGTVENILLIVKRLLDLPEQGLASDIQRLESDTKTLQRMEEELRDARESYRRKALKLVSFCRANWSEEEIAEATGY